MDGQGGDKEEFVMLALRLTDGLTNEIWYHKFQEPLRNLISNGHSGMKLQVWFI